MTSRAPRRSVSWPRAFIALWVGQTVSSVGTQLSLVAIPLVAVLALHAGPFELGVLGALETAPFVIAVLPAGLLADTRDRRSLLIASDVGRAVAVATLAVGLVTGVASMPWLYVIALVVGAQSAVFTVAQQAYVPEIVPIDALIRANQRIELSESAARVAGPTLAGVIVASVGGALAVALDSVSYLVSAGALLAAPAGAGKRVPLEDDDGWRAAVRGLSFAARDPILRRLATTTAVFNLASGMVLAQLVLFATADLGVTVAGFGLVLAIGNIGFVVGALGVAPLEERLGIGGVLLLSSTMGGIALVLIALAGLTIGIPLLVAGRFVGACSAPLFNVTLVTVRQQRSPDALRARVAAAFRAIDWGTAPVGAALSGVVGVTVGVPAAMAIAALIGIASVPWLLASPTRVIDVSEPVEPSWLSRPTSPLEAG
jgi:MFS family permease